MRYLVVLLLIVLSIAGCSRDSSLDNPVATTSDLDKVAVGAASSFQYVGYSQDGTAIVRGNITLLFARAGLVSGRWQLRSTVDPGRIGPQVGSGTLTGTYENGVLSVNLNPQNVDNNVVLRGRFNRIAYTGEWQWVGFPGIITGGTFRANRVRMATEENQD